MFVSLNVITGCLHIIHLPHRTDRRILLEKELRSQQIVNFKIWKGIMNETLPVRGISRAHKQIIVWAKQNNLTEVVIAEDDVHFSAPGAFQYFIDQKPNDFDIYLGAVSWGKVQANNVIRDFSGAMLYIAHQRFYDTILDLSEDQNYDRAMAGLGKFIVCNPMVVYPHNGYSDNQRRYIDFGPLVRRMKLFM
ncbi:MAG: hypothetical protein ACSLE0_14020 [Chitinophagaceae bacterium]